MNSPLQKLLTGQILLVVCCVFYLIWWSISYRPGITVNRVSGLNGVLLLITALCGVSGMILSLSGSNHLPGEGSRKLSGSVILIAGVAVYLVMLLLTTKIFHRIVTTELVLITGWAALEINAVSALAGAAVFRMPQTSFMTIVVAAAYIISMILYVAYYRMQADWAFYAAMIPLITEAVSMAILVIVMLASIRK
ncbi:MAG: hypothetical protein ACI4W2_03680 [Eubacterium sp.]